MNATDIKAEMRKRLVELQAEVAELQRMIAAAEGAALPLAPVSPYCPMPIWPEPVNPGPFIGRHIPIGVMPNTVSAWWQEIDRFGSATICGSTLDLTGSPPIGSNTVTIQH